MEKQQKWRNNRDNFAKNGLRFSQGLKLFTEILISLQRIQFSSIKLFYLFFSKSPNFYDFYQLNFRRLKSDKVTKKVKRIKIFNENQYKQTNIC